MFILLNDMAWSRSIHGSVYSRSFVLLKSYAHVPILNQSHIDGCQSCFQLLLLQIMLQRITLCTHLFVLLPVYLWERFPGSGTAGSRVNALAIAKFCAAGTLSPPEIHENVSSA